MKLKSWPLQRVLKRQYISKAFLIKELGLGDNFPISLACDNKAARDLAYNPEHHPRTKHIDRRHFYVRELVELGCIEVPFVATVDNLADFFTKSLPSKRFFALRDKIMNVPPEHASSANSVRKQCRLIKDSIQ